MKGNEKTLIAVSVIGAAAVGLYLYYKSTGGSLSSMLGGGGSGGSTIPGSGSNFPTIIPGIGGTSSMPTGNSGSGNYTPSPTPGVTGGNNSSSNSSPSPVFVIPPKSTPDTILYTNVSTSSGIPLVRTSTVYNSQGSISGDVVTNYSALSSGASQIPITVNNGARQWTFYAR